MDRIGSLREKMLNAEHGQHRILLTDEWLTSSGWKEQLSSDSFSDYSIPERKAYALKFMLEYMPIFIEDDELIVGSRTVFGPKHADQKEIRDPSDDIRSSVYPPYLTEEERSRLGGEGRSKGHYVAGYKKVLELGYGGIIKQAKERMEDEPSQDKRNCLMSICIAYQGASNLARRYADLALEMSQKASHQHQAELEKIAAVCGHIATQPPRDFYEALQLFWFTHVVVMVENQSLMSFGRFDQYMSRFFNTCQIDTAQELLQCALIKLNDQVDAKEGEGHYGSDNLMLSGARPDGRDATNDLTYACLDALDHLRLANPQFNVRLHKNSPPKLVRRVCELARQGIGQLSFYSDDAIIPSLTSAGFPVEDARDYALDACQDVLIDGKSDFYVGGSVRMTQLLMAVLEKIDNNVTFDQLMGAYRGEIGRAVKVAAENYIRSVNGNIASPLPFISGTLDDCIGKGLDVTQGGLKYRDKGMFLMSPVNAVNSLASIKKIVFEDRVASLEQVKRACSSNFEDYDLLRQQLLAAPKWGNDDDRVDLLGKEVLEFACREVLRYRIDDEARFLSGIHQPHQVRHGAGIGATPDGRKAGEPVAITLTPTSGTDRKGPTAVIKSVTKIDPMLCQWNSALLLNFHSSAVAGQEVSQKFEHLLKTFISLGGVQLQTNVLDVETLRAAQREPEKYGNLIIRVWGFSAYFVNLSKPYQEEIMSRTLHTI